MAMSTASQGIWLQETVDGKPVWHFYPTQAMTLRSDSAIETPPPVAPTDKIIVHPPGQHAAGGSGGGPHLTYNVYNVYNYPVAAPEQKQEEKKAVEPAPEQKGICITEEEVKMDALLHEQAEALRMLRHLHTVDYGAGDVYGRRWIGK